MPFPVRLGHTWVLYLGWRNGKLFVLSCLVSFSVIRELFFFENLAIPEAALGNIKIKTIIFKIWFPAWIYNQTPNISFGCWVLNQSSILLSNILEESVWSCSSLLIFCLLFFERGYELQWEFMHMDSPWGGISGLARLLFCKCLVQDKLYLFKAIWWLTVQCT